MADVEARERAVLSLLDRWPWRYGGVVIGGYAVAAYGPPRHSDDVDIVIPESATGPVRGWLEAEGLKLTKRSIPNPENFSGQVERYRSPPITLDLLAAAVRDRDAAVDIPESWISKAARRQRLATVSGRTSMEVPIARPEALWALKLQAGRAIDISDLFAIADTPFDVAEVVSLYQGLRTSSLVGKLRLVRARLGDPKTYADSLSRRQAGRPSEPASVKRWQRFVAIVDRIIAPIVEG